MKSAEHTLAANMASSISLCASLRVRGTIFSMRPDSSHTIWVSTVSKSTAPRAWRATSSARYTSCKLIRYGSTALRCAASGPRVFCSAAATSVYVRRAWLNMTAG